MPPGSNASNIEVATAGPFNRFFARSLGEKQRSAREVSVTNPEQPLLTQLALLALNGETEKVRMLLDQGAALNVPEDHGLTAIYLASLMGHTDVVKVLLEYGDEPNPVGNESPLPLIAAAEGGHAEILELLIAAGANVNRQGPTNLRANHVSPVYDVSALMLASGGGNENIVYLLLRYGANLELTDSDGDTALFYAASRGNPRVVDILLNAGANPNYHKVTGGNDPLAVVNFTVPLGVQQLPPGRSPDDFWKVSLRLLRGGADPSVMYSGRVRPVWNTYEGTQVIALEDLHDFIWYDDLQPVYVVDDSLL